MNRAELKRKKLLKYFKESIVYTGYLMMGALVISILALVVFTLWKTLTSWEAFKVAILYILIPHFVVYYVCPKIWLWAAKEDEKEAPFDSDS